MMTSHRILLDGTIGWKMSRRCCILTRRRIVNASKRWSRIEPTISELMPGTVTGLPKYSQMESNSGLMSEEARLNMEGYEQHQRHLTPKQDFPVQMTRNDDFSF